MRKASILISALAFCVVGLFAQDDDLAKYSTWMKAAAGANGAVRAAVTAKDAAAITDNANKMAQAFDQIATYWAGKHKDDAVKFAEDARDAAKSLASASSADDQNAALMKIGGTCRGCHTTYRDGSKFKQ